MTAIVDYNGPDVPLGFVKVVAPGTPVQLTSVIDPTGVLAPEVSNKASGPLYPPLRFQQLMLTAMKPNAQGGGMQDNTGTIYIVRSGYTRADPDGMVAIIKKGVTLFLASAPSVLDTWNPYRYYVDADNADDGVVVVGIKQG
jgi:hypothetical protein